MYIYFLTRRFAEAEEVLSHLFTRYHGKQVGGGRRAGAGTRPQSCRGRLGQDGAFFNAVFFSFYMWTGSAMEVW